MIGTIQEIITDELGYENRIKIKFVSGYSVWCYVLSTFGNTNSNCEIQIETVDGSVVKITPGTTQDFELSAVFVNEIEKIENTILPSITQPMDRSPHTQFIAEIQTIEDDGNFKCNLGTAEEHVLIEMEKEVKEIMIGDTVTFTGELKANLK